MMLLYSMGYRRFALGKSKQPRLPRLGLNTNSFNLGRFLHYPTGNLLGLYAASFFLPTIFTAYIGDYCARRLGRRKTVALGTLIILCGSLINALATNPGMWVAGMC